MKGINRFKKWKKKLKPAVQGILKNISELTNKEAYETDKIRTNINSICYEVGFSKAVYMQSLLSWKTIIRLPQN